MTCFFDTSALIKNYIDEKGSDIVASILNETDDVYISEICLIECISTLRRLKKDKLLSNRDYINIKNEIKTDMQYFQIIGIDTVYKFAEQIIDKHQLKSLDSIQLGSAIYVREYISHFVSCDIRLNKAAQKEGLKIMNPTKPAI